MILAYDGGPFRGFARQAGVRTVQGTLEDALSKVLRFEVKTSAAGRTDAGVHALGQVVSFSTAEEIADVSDLKRRLNAMCGPEIAVLGLEPAGEGFDARFSASSRTYEYAVLNREVPDPFSRYSAWHVPGSLDLEAMRKAAGFLSGEHDFSSFARVEESQNSVRRIESIEIDQQEDLILFRITANGFLQQMVRSIVGTLVNVGAGKIPPDAVEEILRARDRAAAAAVAPPHGLFLVSVAYPEELV
jgi:tRNA pseudouridine38-40 synthase